MTPPEGFVKDLRAYDPALRVRWGEASKTWIIERFIREHRHPQLYAEMPPRFSRVPWLADEWVGWQEGYVSVGRVNPGYLHWNLIAPKLRAVDLYVVGGKDALIRKLDAADAAWEAERERDQQNIIEAAISESYDRLKWLGKERISVPEEIPSGDPQDA